LDFIYNYFLVFILFRINDRFKPAISNNNSSNSLISSRSMNTVSLFEKTVSKRVVFHVPLAPNRKNFVLEAVYKFSKSYSEF